MLGYGKAGTFFKIIFPQMVKRIMPPVTNEVITLVKDTSLAFAIAYTEMFTLSDIFILFYIIAINNIQHDQYRKLW